MDIKRTSIGHLRWGCGLAHKLIHRSVGLDCEIVLTAKFSRSTVIADSITIVTKLYQKYHEFVMSVQHE